MWLRMLLRIMLPLRAGCQVWITTNAVR